MLSLLVVALLIISANGQPLLPRLSKKPIGTYIVRIQQFNQFIVTGSILGENSILTDFSNVFKQQGTDVQVVYKTKHLYTSTSNVADFLNIKYLAKYGNLVLLKLKSNLDIENATRVYLPEGNHPVPYNKSGTLIKWKMDLANYYIPEQINMTIYPNSRCKNTLSLSGIFDEKFHFCAGTNKSVDNFKPTDVGAPFMLGNTQIGMYCGWFPGGVQLFFKTSKIPHRIRANFTYRNSNNLKSNYSSENSGDNLIISKLIYLFAIILTCQRLARM